MCCKSYSIVCPQGFVVPEHPDDARVTWVEGTGCAVACRYPLYTADEWNQFLLTTQVTSWVSFTLIGYLIINFLTSKKKRKEYLVICFSILSFLATLPFCIFVFFSFSSFFCYDNAIQIDFHDGFTACSFQTIAITYGGLGTIYSYCALTIDLYIKLVVGFRDGTSNHKFILIIIVLTLPLISVIYILVKKKYGFLGNTPLCFIFGGEDVDMDAFFYPLLIAGSIGLLVMVLVFWKIANTRISMNAIHPSSDSNNNNNNNNNPTINRNARIKYLIRIMKYPIMLSSSLIVLIAVVWSFRGFYTINDKKVSQSFEDFTTCVFTNFDGVSNSWENICGKTPKYRLSPTSVNIFMASLSLQSAFVFFIFNTGWIFLLQILGAIIFPELSGSSFDFTRKPSLLKVPLVRKININNNNNIIIHNFNNIDNNNHKNNNNINNNNSNSNKFNKNNKYNNDNNNNNNKNNNNKYNNNNNNQIDDNDINGDSKNSKI